MLSPKADTEKSQAGREEEGDAVARGGCLGKDICNYLFLKPLPCAKCSVCFISSSTRYYEIDAATVPILLLKKLKLLRGSNPAFYLHQLWDLDSN